METTIGSPFIPLHFDISDQMSQLPAPVRMAAWLFVPPDIQHNPPHAMLFCLPGGSYTKSFYHLEVPGSDPEAYSFGLFLARQGFLVLAIDHLGTSESGVPDVDPQTITLERTVMAHTAVAALVDTRLENGTLSLGLPHPERCVLVSVGRLAAEKNIEHLFLILAALDTQIPRCHLAIIGDGPYFDRLQRLSRGLPPVTFLGKLAGIEYAEAAASADVLCVPSMTETFGNTTLEAMASGLAVVGVRAGGTIDLVQEQQTGFLVDPAHPTHFLEAVRLVRDDEALRVSLGSQARRVAETMTWTRATKSLRQSYARIQATQEEVA